MVVVARSSVPERDQGSRITAIRTDEACRRYLEELRWPDGVRCPRCGGSRIARMRTRRQYDCSSCRYRFSVTAGTIFHDSHLPLWKWFAAVYLMIEARNGLTSMQLGRTLELADKTAWYLAHRIRRALRDRPPILEFTVERDGGKHMAGSARAVGARAAMQSGYPLPSEERGRTAGAALLDSLVRLAVSERLGRIDHDSSISGQRESAWSALKTSIRSSHGKVSTKHLPAYLDEFTFRLTRPEAPHLFRETLLRLVEEDPLSYTQLTRSES
jgi:transposase-like protein